VEEFRYTLNGSNLLQVDWSVARKGQPLYLGDTLTCTREDEDSINVSGG
jgi:hypothetical protein